MAKAKLSPQEKADQAEEQQRNNQLLRRRLVGAFVVFAATFLLWEIDGMLPPQHVMREVPPLEVVFPEQEVLSAADAAEEDADNELAESLDAAMAQIEQEAAEEEQEALLAAQQQEQEAAQVIEEQEEAPAIEEPEAAPAAEEQEVEPAIEEEALSTAIAENSPALSHVVQVGAFSQLPRAQEVVDNIEKQGFVVLLQPLEKSEQTLWRVRVINFQSRAEAERGQKKLQELGHADTQVLVTTEEAAPAAAAAATADADAGYVLRVGTFQKKNHLDRAIAAVKQTGAVVDVALITSRGIEMSRVSAVGIATYAEAEQMRAKLRQAGYLDAAIEAEQTR